MNWVKESAQELPEDEKDHPVVAELDELQTYVGRKTDKIWLWTAINHHAPGILAIEIGDCSGQTFAKLWQRIRTWESRR
ncbi:MAG: IS1 family transposase [Chroococcidiopsidaceae cyanobacterium CP_BM_RX_35]|nr:IS1 family transposase [Chroococcidiopsidaceae cyanobacterium CP_BM_RX_35]